MSDDRAKVPIVRLGELLIDSCYGTSELSGASGSTPVLGITHIRDGRVRMADMSRITLPEAERRKLALRPGDILLTRTSSYDLVGQTALVASETDAVFASYLVRLRVNEGRVRPAYLNYYLNSPAGRRQVRRLATRAVGQANVNPTQFGRHVRVPLPSLQNQQRIVNMLATWDTATETAERLVAMKRGMLVGSVRAAVEGALGFRQRSSLLGEICAISRGSGLSKDAVGPDGMRPCILYGELYTQYDEVVTDVRSRTDLLTPTVSRRGDVLIPASTTTVAVDLANATALMQDDVLLGGDINILRARESEVYDSEYLAYYLTHVQSRAIARLAQGSTIVHLYGRDLARIGVTLPAVEVQRRVALALRAGRREIHVLDRLGRAFGRQKQAWMSTVFPPDGGAS